MGNKEPMFKLGRQYRFDLPTYIQQEGHEDYLINKCWIDIAHGNMVHIVSPIEGAVPVGSVEFVVRPEWCVEV